MTISKSSIAAVEDPVTLGAIETANGSFADTPERRAYLNASESSAVNAANDAAGFQNAVTRALQPDPNAVLDALDAQKMIEPSTRVRDGLRAARTMAYARDILKNPDRYQDGDAFAALNALSDGFAHDISEWKRIQGMTDDPRRNLATYVNMLDGLSPTNYQLPTTNSTYSSYYEAIRSPETRDWDALDSAPLDVRFSHAIGKDPGGKRFTDAAKDWVHANLFDEDKITPEEEAAWVESEGGRESDAMRRYFANLYARGKSAKDVMRERERQQAIEGASGVIVSSQQDDGRIPDQEWKVNQRMNKDGTFTHDRIDTLTNLTLDEYADTEKRRDAFVMKRRVVDAYQKRMDQKKAEDRAHAMLPFLDEYEAAAALSAMRGEDMAKYKAFFENGFGDDTERRDMVWSVCASLRPRDAHGAWEDLIGRFGEGVDRAAFLSGKAASSLWNSYSRWSEIIGTRIGAGREAAVAEKRQSDEELKEFTNDMRFSLQYRQTMEAWIPNTDDNFAEQAVKGLADSGFLQGAAITGSLAHMGGSALLGAPHPAARIVGAALHAVGFISDAFGAAYMIGDSFENMMLNGVDAERAAVVGLYAGSLKYLIEKGNVDMFLGQGLSPAEMRRTGFRALFKAIARKDPKLVYAAIKADAKQAGLVALSECAEEFGQVLVDSGALKFAKNDEFSARAFANAYLDQDTLKDGIDAFIDAIPTCTGFGIMANHSPLRSKNAQAIDAYEQLADETAKRYALKHHVDTANAEDMAKVKRLVLENAARHARAAAGMDVEQRRAYFGKAAQEAGMSPSESAFYEQAADLYKTLTSYEGQQFADAAMHGEINEAVLARAGISVGHDANGDINAVTVDGHTRTVVTEHGARTATDTHTGETGNVRGYYDPKDDAIHITVPETAADVGETARTTTAPHELLHAALEAMANDPAITEEQRNTLDALVKTETPSPNGTQLDANEAAAQFVERVFAVANRDFTPDREVVALGNVVRNIGISLKNALGAKSEYLPSIVTKAGKGGISVTDLLDPSFLANLDALQIADVDKGTADPVVAWYANTMQPFFKALVDAKSRAETSANIDAAEAQTAAERGDTRGNSAAAGISFEDTTSSTGDLEPVADTETPSQSSQESQKSQPSHPTRPTINLPNGYSAEYELEEMPLSYVVMPGDPDYDQNLAGLNALQEADPEDGIPVVAGGGNLLCGANAVKRALDEGKTRITVRRVRRLRKDKQTSGNLGAFQEAKRTGVRRFIETHGNAYPALRYWLEHGRHVIDGSDPYIKAYLDNLSPADRMFLTGFGKGGTTADLLVEDFLNQHRNALEQTNERHYDGTMKPEDVLDQALRERDAYRQWKADGALSPDEQQARDEHDKFIADGHTEDEWNQHLEDLGNPLLEDETTTASDAESAAIDAQIADDVAKGFFSLVREYDDILGDQLAAMTDAPRYSLTKDEQTVYDRYHDPDGKPRNGWMKAPNGKPTRLTERQWLQVRTSDFKNWFGDWETESVRNFIETETVAEAIGNEYEGIGRKEITNAVFENWKRVECRVTNPQIGEIHLTKSGIHDSLAHGMGRAKIAAFNLVPDILSQGRVVRFRQNWEGRGYDSHVLAAPVVIGGDRHVAIAIVNSNAGGNRFYLHEVGLLDEIKKSAEAFRTGSSSETPALSRNLGDVSSIALSVFDGNGASKVVDENGEPLVVWHGDENPSFTVFDPAKVQRGNGFWFSDMDNASSYAKNGEPRAFFLCAKRLATEIDLHGALLDEYHANGGDGASWRAFVWDKAAGYFLRSRGYDGIAFGGNTIVFEPTQIKSATDNNGAFRRTNADIRYSVARMNEAARRKDLLAVHNLNVDSIKKIADMGGFAMPSIAIVKDDYGHREFGDCTVLFDKSTIDPKKNRLNRVYSHDAWTATFPAVSNKIDLGAIGRKNDELVATIDGRVRDALRSATYYLRDDDGIRDSWDRAADAGDAYGRNDALKAAYLVARGEKVEPAYKDKSYIRGGHQRVYMLRDDGLRALYDDPVGKKLIDIYLGPGEESSDQYEKVEPQVAEVFRDIIFKREFADDPDAREYPKERLVGDYFTGDNKLHFGELNAIAEALVRLDDDIRNGKVGVQEVDEYKTRDEIGGRVADNDPGFVAWLKEQYGNPILGRGVYNGKERFTPSGSRRSWDALHDPATLENIVRAMKKTQKENGNSIFGSNPFGVAARSFRSMKDIFDSEGILRELTHEEEKAIKEGLTNRLSGIVGRYAKTQEHPDDNPFVAADRAADMMFDAYMAYGQSIAGLKRELNGWGYSADDQLVRDFAEVMEAIETMPTNYFEAKPQRAVRFDEMKAWIVPDTITPEDRKILEGNGQRIYTYKAGDETDRLRAVNAAADETDVRFSLRYLGGADLTVEDNARYFKKYITNINPAAEPERISDGSPKSVLEWFLANMVGKTYSFDIPGIGKRVFTPKAGHIGKLVCSGKGKGIIHKPYEGQWIDAVLRGDISGSDVNGWDYDRAKSLPLIDDMLTSFDALIYDESRGTPSVVFMKRYVRKDGKTNTIVMRVVSDATTIGPISAHVKDVTLSWLMDKKRLVVNEDGQLYGMGKDNSASDAHLPSADAENQSDGSDNSIANTAANVNAPRLSLSLGIEGEADPFAAKNNPVDFLIAHRIFANGGKPPTREETDRLLKRFGSKEQPRDVIARAVSISQNIAGFLDRIGQNQDVVRAVAAAGLALEAKGAQTRAQNALMRFDAKAAEAKGKIDAAYRRQVENATGIGYSEMLSYYGLDMEQILLAMPPPEQRATTRKNDTNAAESPDAYELTDDDRAAVDAAVSAIVSRGDGLAAAANAEHPGRPVKASLSDASSDATDDAEADQDFLRAQAMNAAVVEAVRNSGITIDNPLAMVALVRRLTEDYVRRNPDVVTDFNDKDPFSSRVALAVFASNLSQFAQAVAQGYAPSYARVRIARLCERLDARGLTTLNQVERVGEMIFSDLSRDVIRQSRADLMRNLHHGDAPKNGKANEQNRWRGIDYYAKKHGVNLAEPDRVVSAFAGNYLRILKRSVELSQAKAAERAAKLQETVDAFKDTEDKAKYRDYQNALLELDIISAYGALRTKMPAEIADKAAAIKAFVMKDLDKLNAKKEAFEQKRVALRDAMTAAIQGNQKDNGRMPDRHPGFLYSLVGMLDARASVLTSFCKDPAKRKAALEAFDYVQRLLFHGYTQERAFLNDAKVAMRDAVKSVFGRFGQNTFAKLLDTKLDEATCTLLDRGNQKTKWRIGNVMQMYVSCLQSDYADNCKTHGRDAAYVQQLKAVIEQTDPRLLKMIDVMRTMYAEYGQEISKATISASGVPIQTPNPLYMPVKPLLLMRAKNGEGRAFHPYAPSLTPRVKHGYDFDQSADIMEMWQDRIQQSAHTIGFLEAAPLIQGTMQSSHVLEAIHAAWGEQYANHWNDYVLTCLAGRKATSMPKVMAALSRAASRLFLWFNVGSNINQLQAVFTSALSHHVGGIRDTAKHISFWALKPVEMWNAARDLTATRAFKARYGSDLNAAIAAAQREGKYGVLRSTVGTISDVGMKGIEIGDKIGVLALANVYRSERIALENAGMSPAEASEQAAEKLMLIAENTAQGTTDMNTFDEQSRLGSLTSLFMQFKTAPLQQFGYEFAAFQDWKADPTDTKRAMKLLSTIIVNHVLANIVPTAIDALMTTVFGAIRGDDDKEKEKNRRHVVARALARAFLGPFGAVMFYGVIADNAVQFVANWMTEGKPVRKPYGSSGSLPADNAVEMILNAAEGGATALFKSLETGTLDDLVEATKEAAVELSTMTYPGRLIKKSQPKNKKSTRIIQ